MDGGKEGRCLICDAWYIHTKTIKENFIYIKVKRGNITQIAAVVLLVLTTYPQLWAELLKFNAQ